MNEVAVKCLFVIQVVLIRPGILKFSGLPEKATISDIRNSAQERNLYNMRHAVANNIWEFSSLKFDLWQLWETNGKRFRQNLAKTLIWLTK